MATNCVFCKIISREEQSDILYEDDEIIIFKDIKPAAKTHVLVVPKIHIENAKILTYKDREIVEKLVSVGKKFIEDEGLDVNDTLSGFHWPPFNSINHLHLHFINPASTINFISRAIFRPNSLWFVTPKYVLNRISKLENNSHL